MEAGCYNGQQGVGMDEPGRFDRGAGIWKRWTYGADIPCWRKRAMLTSLALIFLLGLAAAAICQRVKLPSDNRYAVYGNFTGAICAESAG